MSVTVETLWKAYCQYANINAADSSRWQRHLKPAFGGVSLTDLNSRSILAFKISLEQKQLSPQSIKHCLAQLRRIINKGIRYELVPNSYALPYIEMPRFDNKRIRFLSTSEAKLLLSDLKKQSQLWHDIALLALHTGLRAGEIFKLRQEHINISASTAFIFDTKTCQNRTAYLNSSVTRMLRRYMKGHGFVFTHISGSPINEVSKIFFKSVVNCGFNNHITDRRQRIVFHSLRHTFASWLVMSGRPIAVVSRLLGHKSIDMTMRYAHLAPSEGLQAVEQLTLLSL